MGNLPSLVCVTRWLSLGSDACTLPYPGQDAEGGDNAHHGEHQTQPEEGGETHSEGVSTLHAHKGRTSDWSTDVQYVYCMATVVVGTPQPEL